MKIKQLIKILEKMDGDRIVILQKDGEGNGFSPLAGADDNTQYLPDSTYSGEIGIEKLSKIDKKKGFTEADVMKGKKSVVLFPIN